VVANRVAFLQRQASKKKKDKASDDSKPAEYRNITEVA
jgi:hypothetical protein